MNRASSQFRALLAATLPILLSLNTPFMAWKALSIITASPCPVMCVISESMAPAFHRGDVIILWNRPSHMQVGDIPVVWFAGNPYPMVHRAIQVYNIDSEEDDALSRQLIVTKGDNNDVADVPLYPQGRTSVSRDGIVGFVRGYVPLLGWAVIALQEVTWIKYLIFALVSIFCLFN